MKTPRPRAAVLVASCALLPMALATQASAAVYFDANWTSKGFDPWDGRHQPAGDNRLAIVPGFAGMPGEVLKAVVAPGDKTYTGTYVAERAEVFGRTGGSLSPSRWPDPVGSTRWYQVNINLKPGFEVPQAGDTRWVELTQWKGAHGSVPPIGLLAQWGRLKLKVKRSPDQPVVDLGGADRGDWIRLSIGIKWSTGDDGWVQVYRNGKEVVPRFSTPTMDLYKGGADPIYLKQGIYRGSGFKSTHIAYFGETKIGNYRPEIDYSLLK